MGKALKIGILRETKNPPDRRVPLIPEQVAALSEKFPWCEFVIQPSVIRCFSDDEYRKLDLRVNEDLSYCDVLLGVKEVDKQTFIPGKTYLFFAHVGKKQTHNRAMFRVMAEKKITLIDYEYLTSDKGERVVAFGRWAGIVGAYNGLRAYGIKTGRFNLKPAHDCHDVAEMWAGLDHLYPGAGLKILVTGGGRVAGGALETLNRCRIKQVIPGDFIDIDFDFPVMCRIGPEFYASSKKGEPFEFEQFVRDPGEFESAFSPFAKSADLLIAGHFWDPRSPVLFTKEDMKNSDFRISVIADISCDINGSVPSTIRATSISDPFYGYNPLTGNEEPAFSSPGNITVMAIDNLPGELPRDASTDFGNQLLQNILPDLLSGSESPMLQRATILKRGMITGAFEHLSDYFG